jgi:hypothetical protein
MNLKKSDNSLNNAKSDVIEELKQKSTKYYNNLDKFDIDYAYEQICSSSSGDGRNKSIKMFQRVYCEYTKIVLNQEDENLGSFIVNRILFLNLQNYIEKKLQNEFEKIDQIRRGNICPWDIEPEIIIKISESVGMSRESLIEKIEKHPMVFNTSCGIAARSKEECSTKQRNIDFKDAFTKLMTLNHSQKKEDYIKKIKALSYCD